MSSGEVSASCSLICEEDAGSPGDGAGSGTASGEPELTRRAKVVLPTTVPSLAECEISRKGMGIHSIRGRALAGVGVGGSGVDGRRLWGTLTLSMAGRTLPQRA